MNLQSRAINILTKPKEEWPVIAGEQTTVADLYSGYIVPLSAIPAVCGFIGMSVLAAGVSMFRGIGFGPTYWLAQAVVSYVLGLVAVYIAAIVTQKLAPSFQSEPNLIQALKLVAYASTAGWVAGVFTLIPPLAPLAVLGALYAIYLFYIGLPPLMKTPRDKVIPYMIVAAVVIIVIYVVVFACTALFMTLFYAGLGLGL